MPDYLLTLLYRPLYQQWSLFLALTLCVVITGVIVMLGSPWFDLKNTQQRFQQQADKLAQLRKKVASFPPLQRGLVISPVDESQLTKKSSLGALGSIRDSVKVVRWQMKTAPGELELQLQWDDLVVVFEHLAELAQPCIPEEFTLSRGQDSLALRLRLCGNG